MSPRKPRLAQSDSEPINVRVVDLDALEEQEQQERKRWGMEDDEAVDSSENVRTDGPKGEQPTGRPQEPVPRITLTHRGSIELVSTQLADGVAEPGATIRGPEDVVSVLRQLIAKEDREHVALLMLDGAHRLVGASIVSIGTASSAPLHPREFFKAAILTNSVAVICGHNHPSGEVVPSLEDKRVANLLRGAGRLLGIPLLDFVIVSKTQHLSFRDSQVIKFDADHPLEDEEEEERTR